eukprot:62217-Pyramimonas_sp.AAC.1
MEHSCQIDGASPSGSRDDAGNVRWCSVRSESGRRWICLDLFKLTIDRQKPNQDLYHFHSERMERYQELYGAREPSDEMKASVHAHFYEHIRQVPREQCAISEHESTLDSRNRQARLTGGMNEGGGGRRSASAMAAAAYRLGLPGDKLASERTKGETTCIFVRQGENCPAVGQG